ncbi:hypothetical protein DAPPUDRAFT_113271 [Daphnia pulex]|uniref:Uncharacterized protein n=1 Tax=Daphnia pulex TaxID=6669 RepID=E9HEJ4_DAPPU|nr:hypothetical protein DAPPUDRAFT_113271 [Daphnia pulex]|eukprot:EFX69867.1 hypothetical protein DAPPUDRAFT_113271 [Daphnia pulex]
MIITLVRRRSLALLECWDLPLDRRETELLLARRLQVMGADLGLVPPGPARQRLTCFGYSGPPAYYSDPNYYTVATPSYSTTEAAKYYSDPSYSTKAPEYYTTAAPSYYVDPSYYTAAVPSYYSAPSYTATYYAKAAPEYYTTTAASYAKSYGYIQFIVKEVPDTSPQLLDNVLRILLQLLSTWRNGVIAATHRSPQEEPPSTISKLETASALRAVEGLALVMLCQCRLPPRRVLALILKEVKLLLKAFGLTSRDEESVLDVMDSCCASVLDKWSHLLPSSERAALQNVDLQWLSERSSPVWTPGVIDDSANKGSVAANSVSGVDVWSSCLCSFLEKNRVTSHCLSATANAWTIVFTRLNSLYIVVDPTPVSDNRASLLRSAATVKRPVNERDVYLHLWKNYVAFACRVVPPSTNPVLRCASPDISLSSSPDGMSTDRSEVRSSGGTVSPSSLYKLIVPLIRCEVTDMRSTVVNALGMINHAANRDLMEELVLYIREALDRKQCNVRRQRRQDALRLHYVNGERNLLHPVVIEFLDGMRQCLELDTDRDSVAGREVRSCFALFVTNLIDCFPLDLCPSLLKRDLRQQLFILFAGWSGKFGRPFGFNSSSAAKEQEPTELELTTVEAMSSVLCCGPCFNSQGLTEDNHSDVYSWLDILLASKNDKVYGLAQETVVILLEFNPDLSPLLDWVVDRRNLRPSLVEKLYPLQPKTGEEFLEVAKRFTDAKLLANRRNWPDAVLGLAATRAADVPIDFIRTLPKPTPTTADTELRKVIKELQSAVKSLKIQATSPPKRPGNEGQLRGESRRESTKLITES